MLKLRIASITLALLFSSILAHADGTDSARTIRVHGEGSVSSPPNMATVELGVSHVAGSAAEALKVNNQVMNQLMKTLTELAVPAKDIQTSQFNVSPEYVSRNQTMELAGYRVSNQVQVHVRDLSNLGKLLDAIVQSGGNQVSGIRFGIDDQVTAMDRARNQAMLEAKRRADLYAKAAGVRVGKVLSIEEQSTAHESPVLMRGMMRESASAVPIALGEQTIEAAVDVRYELLD